MRVNSSGDEEEREMGNSEDSINSNWIWPQRKNNPRRYFLGWPTGLMEACTEIGLSEDSIYS